MYYLWKDKKSTKDNVLVYISDYKLIRADGKVNIDGYGYLDVELVHTSAVKMDCVAEAQKLMKK